MLSKWGQHQDKADFLRLNFQNGYFQNANYAGFAQTVT